MQQRNLSINIKVLDLLYRQVSLEKTFSEINDIVKPSNNSFLTHSHLLCRSDTFIEFAETTLSGYSEDEQNLAYNALIDLKKYWNNDHGYAPDFLIPILDFSDQVLEIKNSYPVCKLSTLLSWRNAYLKLGQDIFVCAYLALLDKMRPTRTCFDWPIYLHVNSSELNDFLKRGIAENHNHLKGGTQSFMLTWCRIMNFPQETDTLLKSFRKHRSNLFSTINREGGSKSLKLNEKLYLAALIRSILFRKIKRIDMGINDNSDTSMRIYEEELIKPLNMLNKLCDTIDRLRFTYGSRLTNPDDISFCYDYTIDPKILKNSYNSDNRSIIGERYLLYRCFKSCLEKELNDFEMQLLYLYLMLKANFRSEMIQNNDQTGFKNFQNYQDRKDDAWDENEYFWEATRLAINHRLHNENIVSMEGRMTVSPDADKNIRKVKRFDKGKRFADMTASCSFLNNSFDFDCELDVDQFHGLEWYYVFHFVKSADNRKTDDKEFQLLKCRNYDARCRAYHSAIGLMEALKKSAYFRSRVRGIDAAANEFHCRAEVFAQEYRYICGEQKIWNKEDNILDLSSLLISKTYHVGEDFLDLADGMRAIDEAIEFLELESCSRLGHCLALGVDPYIHYATKHFEVITTKQDRLDDLIWILFRSVQLKLNIEPSLKERLEREAWLLLQEIYGKAINSNKWNLDLRKYWCSMHLRGDNPNLYETKKFKKTWTVLDIDNYSFKTFPRDLSNYRNDPEICGLYYYYHFGNYEYEVGKETYEFRVDSDYIDLMSKLQEAMMAYISKKHLFIECNPSSNVLIGTFKDYKKHPIFRFNNRLLDKNNSNCVQLSVCVNTDDIGVFDTSLEFEYALLYQAAREMREIDPECTWSDHDIIDYLDDLRKIGLRAVFPEGGL